MNMLRPSYFSFEDTFPRRLNEYLIGNVLGLPNIRPIRHSLFISCFRLYDFI